MTKELLEKARKVVAEMPVQKKSEMFGGLKAVAKTTPKKTSAKKTSAKKTDGVGAVAKKLILAGKTNAQVLEALGKQFGEKDFAVGGPKRYYGCWYRAALIRAGELKAVRS